MKVVFFCFSIQGIGHITRTLIIARKLLENNCEVKILFGGLYPKGLKLSEGIDIHFITTKTNRFDLDERLNIINNLRNVLYVFRPNWLIVEHFPFGRSFIKDEMKLLFDNLQELRKTGLLKIGLSVRDIVYGKSKLEKFHQVSDYIIFFDKVFIHSDINFVRNRVVERYFPAEKIIYTGYIKEPSIEITNSEKIRKDSINELRKKRKIIFCSFGGGRNNMNVVQTLISIAASSKKDGDKFFFVIVLGPYSEFNNTSLPKVEQDNLIILNSVESIEMYLEMCDLFIGFGGYNTFTNILNISKGSIILANPDSYYEQKHRTEIFSKFKNIEYRELSDLSFETIRNYNFSNIIGENEVDLNGDIKLARLLTNSV